jgi:hypothetical protein
MHVRISPPAVCRTSNVYLWDLAMEGQPVVTLQVHEEVRPRVSGLS